MYNQLMVLMFAVSFATATNYKVICFWDNFAAYRENKGKHLISNIDPKGCTHLVYASAVISNEGMLMSFDSWFNKTDAEDISRKSYAEFNYFKKRIPELKTMLSIGGLQMDPTILIDILMDDVKKYVLITNISNFLRLHQFDGIDFDFEYLQQGGSSDVYMDRFISFCEMIKLHFFEDSKNKHLPSLILSISIPGMLSELRRYDLNKLTLAIDLIIVQGFDFISYKDKVAEHGSPLLSKDHSFSATRIKTVSDSIDFMLENNVPAEKIILGIPFYGRTFILKNETNNTPGSEILGAGAAGLYTRSPGILAYYEICSLLKEDPAWKQYWVLENEVAYASKERYWIAFDNALSITYKAKLVIDKKIGGIMLYSIDQDDNNDICNEGKNILLHSVITVLESNGEDVFG